MNEILLSICIPTYNRAEYLKQAIMSILKASSTSADLIEVCVSDNASTDETSQIICELKKITPFKIKYLVNDYNFGPDKNYLRVIDMAEGEYCWFFGSDDVMIEGAVAKVLGFIKSQKDIYLFDRFLCDKEMNIVCENQWLETEKRVSDYYFCCDNDVINYFGCSKSLGAIFSYLSSIVFRRKKWYNYDYDKRYDGTGYSHVYLLLKMLNDNGSISYIKESLVMARGGNDYFMRNGFVRRCMLDINGYMMLADDFYKDTEYYAPFVGIIKKERSELNTLAKLVLNCDKEIWSRIVPRLATAGYSKSIMFFIWHIKPFIKIAYFLYKVSIR